MIYIYYVLIFLMSISSSICLYYLLKKTNKNEVILKTISLVLVTLMFIRYMLGETAIEKTQALNMYSVFGDNIFFTIVGVILVWFSYASILLIALYPFFKIKTIENILKFVAFPTIILDFIFFYVYGIAVVGTEAFNTFDIRTLLMSIEIIISFSYLSAVLIRKDYFKITKKEIINLLITIIPVLIAIMPAYTIQVFFGYSENANLSFDELTPAHRILLYLSILIPFIIYYALKNKSEEIRRFSMIYLSLATLWTFLSKYSFSDVLHPTNWPIHLCNTAMFIIPLCLIFKMKRLFYFTFFINVLGAFLAMIMPDVDSNPFSTGTVLFWINHFCAFFMPVLIVFLRLFERPKLKQWIYSMISFCLYFIFVLFMNALLSNYGNVDFFFLNSDFIVDKLGKWAEDTRDIVVSFKINEKITLTFYPLYQFLFFIVYAILALLMWFFYEQLFAIEDLHHDMRIRNRKIKLDELILKARLKGRSVNEPMNEKAGCCIELKNFSKRYGYSKGYAVDDVSLKVKGGEIFGFLGPNGAGKSTIIKSIVGMQTITHGSIEVCGYDVDKQPVEAKRQIGFVPDHYALYENLTGREYINYIADLYEVSKEERDQRIERYINIFELKEAFDNQMKTYSHGMKQKIAIMAALVHNPKVWILDEPLTGLDPTSIHQVKECMKQHAKEGNIVFFSSHIIDVVERICDRIAIIRKGKLVCEANVKDLEKQKILLEDYYLQAIGGKENE